MAKFPEAENRLFKNKYVCRRCKSVTRSNSVLVMKNKSKCRKCNSKVLRPKKRK